MTVQDCKWYHDGLKQCGRGEADVVVMMLMIVI